MEPENLHYSFCDLLPIIEKAAPTISTLLGQPVVGTIIGLFAGLFGANACKQEEIAGAMKADPDLFAKLSRLDSTHGEWLKKQ